nr:MAG TPA: hypothetical protein [Caudoviricetes sp.]
MNIHHLQKINQQVKRKILMKTLHNVDHII